MNGLRNLKESCAESIYFVPFSTIGKDGMDSVCTNLKVNFRKPLVYPVGTVLTEATMEALVEAQELLVRFQSKPWPITLESITRTLKEEDSACRFRHPLSEHYAARNPFEPLSGRTFLERRHIESISLAFEDTLNYPGYSGICEFLQYTAECLTGRSLGVRQSQVSVIPDNQGYSVTFIKSSEVRRALITLWQYLADSFGNQVSIFRASTAAIGLMNCHPFVDGNGRLARALFNVLTARTTQTYIPLYEFYNCTPGGHVLRIRQAELFGDWDDWIRFHCDIISFMANK